MRTVRNLLAVDFVTGKRVWEVPVDDPFDSLVEDQVVESPFVQSQPLDLRTVLRFRVWGDATFGTLSSDGRYVFAVEDLPLDGGLRATSSCSPIAANLPAIRDRSTGWRPTTLERENLPGTWAGGPRSSALPLAGYFFLGPPLPLSDQLYVLAEFKGEIRLVVLDAGSGKQLWTQQLA